MKTKRLEELEEGSKFKLPSTGFCGEIIRKGTGSIFVKFDNHPDLFIAFPINLSRKLEIAPGTEIIPL